MANRLTLGATMAVAMVIDVILTTQCQPDCYWTNYYECNEACPIAYLLLQTGPDYFLAAFALYTATMIIFIWKLGPRFGTALALGLLIGHACEGSTWLNILFLETYHWFLRIAYFVLLALFHACLPQRT